MRSSSVLLLIKIVSRLIIVIALASSSRSFAVEQPSDIPAWLRSNVGEGEDRLKGFVGPKFRRADFSQTGGVPIRRGLPP